MQKLRPNRVVHLELHTGDLRAACDFYAALCGWREELVEAGAGAYVSLGLGGGIEGGVVECGVERPLWLPYVEVDDAERATRHAVALGAGVLMPVREGPAGRRSVVSSQSGAQVAFWQPKG